MGAVWKQTSGNNEAESSQQKMITENTGKQRLKGKDPGGRNPKPF